MHYGTAVLVSTKPLVEKEAWLLTHKLKGKMITKSQDGWRETMIA